MQFLHCLFYVIYCIAYYIFVEHLLSVFLKDFGYSFNFTSGGAYCLSMGATMVSLEQLTAAKDNEYFRYESVK